ncbi:Chromosome partition protein Smc [Posidoniimonas polymericola]|uniref:Chromosome partition protein Smc n=1 Tax=Posidoniimonas polymericola TaxID=2528002 RepID=A0A5C5YSY8_9BACT|nr:chromosome segregation protein SMC [Posidoniimonas polymericola]TWT78089.1 Chromosome partition protein Smc [Posidoniimonas polymericola]
MLKALELYGFKSFADKTRLDFHAGVTCVVGPNGSGKSNVVDAIKWVTGTQSAKSLRGKEMTDVIFNGAAHRKPMNAAEVTLEFDNSENLFDLQSPTVRVTRRVYRSGEGEYLINGSPSRLKDIRGLLAGTGVGAEAYSIIEQGRVDAMLRASPRERRGIFEEAAGVSRFRLKKQEAAKRLARVEQNLLRLSDIVDEVEGRLRRVKKQAGRAQKYRDSAERLKHLRTMLGMTDWRSLASREERLQREITSLREESEQGAETLEEAGAELQRLEAQGQQATQAASDADRQLADARERMGAARATISAESSRVAELLGELTHKRNRLTGILAESAQSSEPASVDLTQQLAAARQSLAKLSADLTQLESNAAEAGAHWDERRASLTAVQQELQAKQSEAGEVAADLQKSQDELDATERELEQATTELQRLSEQLTTTTSEKQQADQQAADTQTDQAAHDAAHAEQQAATDDLRRRLVEQQRAAAAGEAHAVSLRHQIQTIEQLETDLQTLRSSVAPQAGDAAPRWSVAGIVADLLHVDYDSAPMVEAALGERAHHLVVDSGAELLAELASGAGALNRRTSLERLDSLPTASVVDRIDLSGEPGVMGRADQFVECEPAHAPLVRRLLGRVWFVDNLATAERLAAGPGRGLSFVTYSGESITADGAMCVGPRDELGSGGRGLLTRKTRGEELRAELSEVEAAVAAAHLASEELEQAIVESQAAERTALELRNQAADANAEARHAARRFSERVESLAEKQHKRQAAAAALGQTQEATKSRLADLRQKADQISAATTELTGREASLKASEAEAGKARATLEQQLVERRVELARAEQRVEILQSQHQQTSGSQIDRGRARTEATDDVRECRARLAERELRVLDAMSSLNLLTLRAETLTVTRNRVHAESADVNHRRRLIDNAVRQRREQLDQFQAERQRHEIELAEVRHEQNTLAGRMRDDYGIDLSAVELDEADLEELADRDAVEREIAALRDDVREVGAINLESIEELDDLEARFNELSAQYTDLSEAKNSLERLTQRINVETRKMFLATVEAVRGEFRELFRQLFGGGEADIVLVDGEGADPLDAGVEIAAQPPGKELSSISLLSGGEKTMTCVALLLSLFRTKPSPFCVLDEVDAALDEANIGRFTGVLSEFLSSTQFIVITHSKKTMTDASTMYGITMQESGVSKQVAVRFEEVDEEGNIRPQQAMGGERKAA